MKLIKKVVVDESHWMAGPGRCEALYFMKELDDGTDLVQYDDGGFFGHNIRQHAYHQNNLIGETIAAFEAAGWRKLNEVRARGWCGDRA